MYLFQQRLVLGCNQIEMMEHSTSITVPSLAWALLTDGVILHFTLYITHCSFFSLDIFKIWNLKTLIINFIPAYVPLHNLNADQIFLWHLPKKLILYFIISTFHLISIGLKIHSGYSDNFFYFPLTTETLIIHIIHCDHTVSSYSTADNFFSFFSTDCRNSIHTTSTFKWLFKVTELRSGTFTRLCSLQKLFIPQQCWNDCLNWLSCGRKPSPVYHVVGQVHLDAIPMFKSVMSRYYACHEALQRNICQITRERSLLLFLLLSNCSKSLFCCLLFQLFIRFQFSARYMLWSNIPF